MINNKKTSILSVAAVGSLLLSSLVQAADVTASGPFPWLIFDDTDTTGNEWVIRGYSDAYRLNDQRTDSSIANPVFEVMHSANNAHSLEVDTSGDINLADGSVFIDRSANRVGIGTSVPGHNLHISASRPGIQLKSSGTEWAIESAPNTSWMWINNVENDKHPFVIHEGANSNLLALQNDGVGIGTQAPLAKLDVRGDIEASWTGSGGGLKEMFKMSANNSNASAFSDTGFVMENKRAGFSWAFRTLEDVGGFAASKQGTGEKEFEIRNTTNIAANVQLFLANGARNVGGQWLNASSRSYKKNIHDLSSEDAMQALRGLKSVKYQFKRDRGNEQRVGFIAEDVPELLATKDRKTVDPLQIIAVLTKAVQEQDKALLELEAENKSKTDLLDKFQKRFAKMESLLIHLTSNSSTGNK